MELIESLKSKLITPIEAELWCSFHVKTSHHDGGCIFLFINMTGSIYIRLLCKNSKLDSAGDGRFLDGKNSAE